MARLHQKRVGFKISGRLDKPPIRVGGTDFNQANTYGKIAFLRKVNAKRAVAFRKSLKPKIQVAFDEIVRVINTSPRIALEDLCASIASKLTKQTGVYYGPTLVSDLVKLAKKKGAILDEK